VNEPIEDVYFDWLCAKVRQDNTPNYLELFRILHSHIFTPVVREDENRVEDAKELREYFLSETGLYPEVGPGWVNQECSVLEVLIAFSGIAEFEIEMSAREWFWQFITNLRLEDYRRASFSDREAICDILDRFVMRDYEPNGDGGLFPLRRPKRDQREVEIWYQFCDYVDDNGLLYGLV
jgi:hypothetical protein